MSKQRGAGDVAQERGWVWEGWVRSPQKDGLYYAGAWTLRADGQKPGRSLCEWVKATTMMESADWFQKREELALHALTSGDVTRA